MTWSSLKHPGSGRGTRNHLILQTSGINICWSTVKTGNYKTENISSRTVEHPIERASRTCTAEIMMRPEDTLVLHKKINIEEKKLAVAAQRYYIN